MGLLLRADFEDAPEFDDFRTWGLHSGATNPGPGGNPIDQTLVAWNTAGGVHGRTATPRLGSKFGFMVLDPLNVLGDGAHPLWKGSQGHRTEYHMGNTAMNGLLADKPVRWYAMSLRLPTAWKLGTVSGTLSRTLFQLHRGPSGGGGSPIWAMRINSAETLLQFTHEDCNSDTTVEWSTGIDIMIEQWVDIVFRIKYSLDTDGEVELWINGQSVFSRTGAATFWCPDDVVGYNKIGIYHQTGILYVDEVRIGDENSTLLEMSPSGGSPERSAALTGTMLPSIVERQHNAKTLIVTVTGDEFIDAKLPRICRPRRHERLYCAPQRRLWVPR